MTTEKKSILHSLILSLKEEDFLNFKQINTGKDLKIELLEFYRTNKTEISDQEVYRSFYSNIVKNEFIELINETENSLLEFYSSTYYKGNTSDKLQKELTFAYTLCQLGHIKKGLDRIKEICEKAKNYNLFNVVAIALDYLLEIDHEYRLNPIKAIEISNEINENSILRDNYTQYKLLSLQIYSYQSVLNIDKKIIQNFFNHPLLKNNTKPKSIIACYFYYMALMDLHEINKNYKEKLKVVNNAVAYFKGVLKNTDFYFPKYYYLLERKAHSELLLKDFNELKKTIDIVGQIQLPESFKNNVSFLYKFEVLEAKYTLSYYLEVDTKKAYHLLQTKFVNFINKKQSSINDKISFYYNIFYHYLITYQKSDEVINLSPSYFKFFTKNFTILNPNNTYITQTFICIFFSAYKTMSKEDFIIFFDSKLYKNKKEINDIAKGDYFFIDKMYQLILKAYDLGSFYNEDLLTEYFEIWDYITEINNQVAYIAKSALLNEFYKVKNRPWMKNKNLNYA